MYVCCLGVSSYCLTYTYTRTASLPNSCSDLMSYMSDYIYIIESVAKHVDTPRARLQIPHASRIYRIYPISHINRTIKRRTRTGPALLPACPDRVGTTAALVLSYGQGRYHYRQGLTGTDRHHCLYLVP